eukprot:TRINITY_DN1398_c0_g1_i15.p1 TRINITY_DN1398_c0_g1~~TRINITY_DN1398_c0_g1_i15.p1  ORF type:complete len:112 (-),score=13.36 TRINITY_DN1398_c0_g1_i15:303-638(-)
MSIATSTESPEITAEEWTQRARTWATTLVSVYDKMEITPYLHVFVYHLGFFLVQCDSLERFANSSTASRWPSAKTAQILFQDLRDFVYDDKVTAVASYFSRFTFFVLRSSF